ncbi:MAG: tetratricopeptide repeat protein [Cyanobacteriota bacterium]|nr:tetratricopeptide repeat protein [Cyanobacteriota bacterium]
MEFSLPIVYLLVLLALLCGSALFVIRQVIKTRTTEIKLSNLQNKLTKESGTAQEYYDLGSIYLDKKLYVKAGELFQKALKAESENQSEEELAKIYNALGFAYFAKEQYDIAIRQYKEAVKLDSDYAIAYNNLGHAYEKKKLTAKALEAYEQVLKLEPKNDTAKRRSESMRRRLTTA